MEHNPGSEVYFDDLGEPVDHSEAASASHYSRSPTPSDTSRSSAQNKRPIWDSSDQVYRCVECSFEVYNGFCEACLAEYEINDSDSEDVGNTS